MTKKIVITIVLSACFATVFYAQSQDFPFLNNLDFEASDPAAIGHNDPFHATASQSGRLCGPWQVSHGTPELDYANTYVNGTGDFVGHYVRLEAQSAGSSGCTLYESEGIFYPNVLSENSQYRMTICYRAYQPGGGTVDKIGVYWARWINGNAPGPNPPMEDPISGNRCSEQGWAKSPISTIMEDINVNNTEWQLFTTIVLGVPGNSFDDALLITLEDDEAARFEVAFVRFECLNNSIGVVSSIDLYDEEPKGSEVAQSISTTGFVPVYNPRKVEFESGQDIILRANSVGQTGFMAEAGSDFLAKITPLGENPCIYTALITGVLKSTQETEGNGKNPKGSGLPDKPDTGLENTDHFSVYPNPFTDVVNFKYSVIEPDSPVHLQIYTITGREVTTLVREERMAAGTYHAQLNGSGLPAGIYMYRLEIGNTVKTGKIILKK